MRILSLNQPKTTLAALVWKILRRWQLGALHVHVSKVTRKWNSWYSLHPTAANQKMSVAHIVLWVVSLSSIECVDVDMFEASSRLWQCVDAIVAREAKSPSHQYNQKPPNHIWFAWRPSYSPKMGFISPFPTFIERLRTVRLVEGAENAQCSIERFVFGIRDF